MATLCFQIRAEPSQPSDPFQDNLIAGRITQAKIALGAKRAARHGGDFLGIKQPIAEIEVCKTEAGNIGEEVEGTFSQ